MKTTQKTVSSVIMLALLTGSASVLAQDENPNGFPSGAHYNLNIIGKKMGYSCTTPEPYLDETGTLVYGNVIFVPESGRDIQIVMKSGSARKGGKASSSYPVFRVTDACAPPFDNDAAEVELPPNANGYRVYARALAKPVADWTISYSGSLFSAQDEYGNDLIDLGLVTSGSVVGPDGVTLVRSKTKSTAVNITKLFEWSGTVCTIVFPDSTDTANAYKRLCRIDADFDSVFSSGDIFSPVDPLVVQPGQTCSTTLCWIDNNKDTFVNKGDTLSRPNEDNSCNNEGVPIAVTGVVEDVPVFCKTYTEPEWIFNIAELVESDWMIDNNGTKLVQIRFYPQ